MGAVCIGHSFGTITLAQLLRYEPDTVGCAAFIDPVVFMLHEAPLCYRFLYRPANTAQDHILRYFAADELHIQHYLRRHFTWHESIVWLEDLPSGMLQRYAHLPNILYVAASYIEHSQVLKHAGG
eukprot:COSAG02_NODE_3451_length_6715_cov_7.265146_4_plen_125_part_00